MPSTTTKALILFAASALAAVIYPPGEGSSSSHAKVQVPETAPRQTAWRTHHGPLPAAVTPTVTLPIACDYSYCDGSTSWCFYWAGVTSYDPFRGPVPGETRVELGPCTVPPPPPPARTGHS
ncbi:hypothetical protein RJ55_01377 [Drechmeria coniospora]|nr:hypothetical protein RJ55_01377 [Drechmeria coniospora]